MVSAWDVYWVMQLDTLIAFLTGLAAATGSGFVLAVITAPMWDDEDFTNAETRTTIKRWLPRLLVICLVAGFVATFTPSSKTLAAMILVPALTSEQVIEPVGAEARELYTLAKQALANVAQRPPEAKPEK